MVKRIFISLVVLPLFVGCMFFQPPVYFRLFGAVALFMGYIEYRGLMQQKAWTINPWPGVLTLFALLAPIALKDLAPVRPLLEPGGALSILQVIALLILVLGVWASFMGDLETGVPRFLAEVTGPLYLGVLGMHILMLHTLEHGPYWVLLVFWYAWMYDAGALFIGKPFGKHKMSVLSPSKSWEGFFGGIVLCALLSGLVLPWIYPADFPLRWPMLVALSIPASLLAQAGDLVESMIKRFAGVKDSSQLISAHGGFLDKLDSSLFVGPFLYMVATLLGVK